MSEQRPPGRPRVAGTDDAVLRSAAELLAEHGPRGLTISAVATRSGVARATVYRRFPNRQALIGAAMRAAVAGWPFPLTGDIERDIREAAQYVQRGYSSPVFIAVFPEIARGLISDPPEIDFRSVGPNRIDLGREYQEHALEQGFDPMIPPHLPFDMTLGLLLGHLLATGKPATPDYARIVGDVVVRALRPQQATKD